MQRSGFWSASGVLRRARFDRRRARLSTRGSTGSRWRPAGEPLEPRALLAVTAALTSGTLQITLGAADDAATLSNDGSNYVVQGTGLPGSFLSANTSVARVSVVGTAAANQSFTVATGTGDVVTDRLTVDASVERTAILGAVNAPAFADVWIDSAAITLAADVTTQLGSSQRYSGAVSLVGQRALHARAYVHFASTVDSSSSSSPSSLAVTTLGLATITFANSVGGTTPLASLVTNLGTTSFGSPSIAGIVVKTSSVTGQAFNGPVSLAGNVAFRAGPGPITFASKVDGAFRLVANSTGTTTFGGAVGGSTALNSLLTNPGGATVFNGGGVTTTKVAGQVFRDAVTLGASTTFKAGDGPVTFASTVDGAYLRAPTPPSAVGNLEAMDRGARLSWTVPTHDYGVELITNTSGTTRFSGAVGSRTPLSGLLTFGIWVATAPITISGITDYVIQRSSDDGLTWTRFVDGVSNLTSAAVTGLTNGRSYVFRVAAVNQVGRGAFSAKSAAVVPVDWFRPVFSGQPAVFGSTLTSQSAGGILGNGDSSHAVFSPDGTKVMFESDASNLVPGDTNGARDVFIKDLGTGVITRVSTSKQGIQGDHSSRNAVFSPDGTKVAFESEAANLVVGDRSQASDVFVKDLVTGAIMIVNTDETGHQANASSVKPVFSPDGTKVAFESTATDLVDGGINSTRHVYVKNLLTGAIIWVSTDATWGQGFGASWSPVFSPDGKKVMFESTASNLVPGDTNDKKDVFLKDLATGAIKRVSTDAAGNQGNFESGTAVFNPDGTKVAFESWANNLVADDTNGGLDVFVKDLGSGAIVRVSTDAAGNQAAGNSFTPIFSPGGTRVAFASDASNLVAEDTNGKRDVFVKDLLTGAIALGSTSWFGSGGGDGDSSRPVLSPNGMSVAFESVATNLTLRDMNARADMFVATFMFVRSQPENTSIVGTFAATDLDPGSRLTYGLTGPDADWFTINAGSGAVSFVAPPDFENPTDEGRDNTYEIQVNVSDGTFVTSVAVVISVTDVPAA